jgi:hypothetical protein
MTKACKMKNSRRMREMLRSERSGSASAQEGGERRRDKPGGQPVIKAVPTFVLAGTLQVHGGIALEATIG